LCLKVECGPDEWLRLMSSPLINVFLLL